MKFKKCIPVLLVLSLVLNVFLVKMWIRSWDCAAMIDIK